MHSIPSIKVSAVVLTRDTGDVALVRKRGTTAWIFPGGKPEPGETELAVAVRELHEELGVVLAAHELRHLGVYITPAANEVATELVSQVYTAQLPSEQHVWAEAEIAEMVWLPPADPVLPAGHRLAPLSSKVLGELSHGKVR